MERGLSCDGEHREAQKLLPWYATETLDAADSLYVATHLARCAECRAEVKAERRLAFEMASLSVDTDARWAEFSRQLDPPSRRYGRSFGLRRLFARPIGVAWLTAVPGAVALLAIMLTPVPTPPLEKPAPYLGLSAPIPHPPGNLIVIFRPEASERDLRTMLTESGARLVDGPTAAGAYVLQVPPARRGAALAMLRRDADIMLAEPIDAP